MKKQFEIIIHGRGGQGAKTSAELLAQAAVLEGKFIQAFPEFGPERSGAPVRSFVRISDDEIRTHQPITDPDCVLVLDETLSSTPNLTQNLTGTEPLIINSAKGKDTLASELKFKGHIVPVDASRISREIIGEHRPNTVILGKFCFVTEVIRLENLLKVFKAKYLTKIGSEKTEKNLEAMEAAYNIH